MKPSYNFTKNILLSLVSLHSSTTIDVNLSSTLSWLRGKKYGQDLSPILRLVTTPTLPTIRLHCGHIIKSQEM